VFLTYVCNSIVASIRTYDANKVYSHDFTVLTFAASTLYVFISIVPLCLWAVMRFVLYILVMLMAQDI
jgi:hypothetical protein